MYIKKQNNYDFIINEAGKSIFQNIYKKCQNEIKDLVITKLLNKIKELNSKIEFLEKENKKLKDNLIYILKRILSNKEEINNNNYKNKYKHTLNKNSDNIYSKNKELTFLENNFSKEKYTPKYSLIESSKTLRYNTEFYNTYNSLINLESENDQTKEAKAKNYLNNLYRNNFSGYTNGTPYKYFINKNKSIYEELFPEANKNYNSLTIKTLSNTNSPKKINKIHRRYNSVINQESIDLENEENTETDKLFIENREKYKFKNLLNKIKKINIDKNKNKKYKRKIYSSADNKNNKKYIQKIKYKNNRKESTLNNADTDNINSNKKNIHKIPYFNRSPFLLNKI